MFRKIKRALRPLIKYVRHTGSARKCPICKRGAKGFLRFGIVSREDAMCPFCGALERHRQFWLFLERRTPYLSRPPKNALHIAPEVILEKKLRPLFGAGYVTADLYATNVDVKMDITAIQYPDSSFDFIYCSHVLEHVPDDRQAMREFRRVLTTDGVAFLLVPITVDKTIEDPTITDPQDRLRLFGQEDHVRRYGPDYIDRLREAGFKVEAIKSADFLTPAEIERLGLKYDSGELFICRK